MGRWLHRHSPILWSAGFYLFCRGIDMLSSLVSVPGFPETNPFSRHADGSFWISHSLVTHLAYFLGIILVSFILYKMFERYDPNFANGVASLPYVYLGVIALFLGAIPNLLIYLRLYITLDPELVP